MEITVNRKVLLEKLGVVKSGISGRSTLAILSHVLLTSKEEMLALGTTDLELSVTAKMELPAMSDEGCVAVPLNNFLQILSGLSAEEVTLKAHGGVIVISAGKSKYTLHTLPGEEFPKVLEVDNKACFDISGAELKGALKEAVVAVSTDDNRAILCAVHLVLNPELGEVLFVATDTHRLVTTKRVPLGIGGTEMKINLPARFVNELVRLLGEENSVQVEVGQSHV